MTASVTIRCPHGCPPIVLAQLAATAYVTPDGATVDLDRLQLAVRAHQAGSHPDE